MVLSDYQCKTDGINFLSVSWDAVSKPQFVVVYTILIFLLRRMFYAYQGDGFMMLASICKRQSDFCLLGLIQFESESLLLKDALCSSVQHLERIHVLEFCSFSVCA